MPKKNAEKSRKTPSTNINITSAGETHTTVTLSQIYEYVQSVRFSILI